jgi:hypothetical protein
MGIIPLDGYVVVSSGARKEFIEKCKTPSKIYERYQSQAAGYELSLNLSEESRKSLSQPMPIQIPKKADASK